MPKPGMHTEATSLVRASFSRDFRIIDLDKNVEPKGKQKLRLRIENENSGCVIVRAADQNVAIRTQGNVLNSFCMPCPLLNAHTCQKHTFHLSLSGLITPVLGGRGVKGGGWGVGGVCFSVMEDVIYRETYIVWQQMICEPKRFLKWLCDCPATSTGK